VAFQYGEGIYGSSTYSFVVVTSGVYGNAGSTYGTARYNSPVYLPKMRAKFAAETLAKNFPRDLGMVRTTFVTTDDPLEALGESAVDFTYNISFAVDFPKLSTLTQFKADQLIEAEAMTQNFLQVAEVIRTSSDEEILKTGNRVGFEGTAGVMTEVENLGIALSHQAKVQTHSVTEEATRTFKDRAGLSSAALISSEGFRILGASATGQTVRLSDIFSVTSSGAFNSVPTFGDSAGTVYRLMYQPYETPRTVTGLRTDLVTTQNVTLTFGSRPVGAVELSVRVGVKSTQAMSVVVFGTGTPENLGSTVFVPTSTNSTTERFVTQRVRVPLTNGKLALRLSRACSTLQVRILGTWG
jgi:hypothetical protein